jgi:hypothetical protein
MISPVIGAKLCAVVRPTLAPASRLPAWAIGAMKSSPARPDTRIPLAAPLVLPLLAMFASLYLSRLRPVTMSVSVIRETRCQEKDNVV